jgi:hypothetical protein
VEALARGHLAVTVGGPNGRAPPTDIFRSLDSAAPTSGDQDVVVPEAK